MDEDRSTENRAGDVDPAGPTGIVGAYADNLPDGLTPQEVVDWHNGNGCPKKFGAPPVFIKTEKKNEPQVRMLDLD